MPLGNFTGSFVRLPDESRVAADQQSSNVNVLYPAARRPLRFMASAVSRTRTSLRPLQANVFQLFQPIVGFKALVSPNAFGGPGTTGEGTAKDTTVTARKARRRPVDKAECRPVTLDRMGVRHRSRSSAIKPTT